jgi:hypothetical protein
MSQFAVDPITTTGLSLGLTAGAVASNNSNNSIAPSVLSMAASQDNWVSIQVSSLSVQTGNPVGSTILYKVTTNATDITSIQDLRGALPTS